MKNPLVAPAAAFAAGIVLVRLAGFSSAELAVCAGGFALLALFGHRHRWPWLRWTAIGLSMLAFGGLDAIWQKDPPVPPIPEGPLLTGCVVEPAVASGDRHQFTLELQPGVRARISTSSSAGEFVYGRRVQVEATLRPVHGFHNPGAFDLEAWMARRQIYWSGSIGKNKRSEVLPGACGTPWRRGLEQLRASALARVDILYPGDAYRSAMMRGLLLGDKSGIRKAWIEDFRRTGTYHALVISGSHITLVCGILLLWRRFFGYGSRTVLVASALIAWLYSLVAGGDAPVLRSAAGFSLFAVAALLYRRTQILNLLAAVALAFLAFDPRQLFDASFQLSFLAVAAIGAFLPHPTLTLLESPNDAQALLESRLVAETLHLLFRVPMKLCLGTMRGAVQLGHFFWEALRLSAAVQVGLALPMALYFHRLSATGLTANVLAVPVVSAAVPVGFVAVFTGWHWPAAIAGWLLDVSQAIAAWHALREPAWRIADPPLWLSLALAASLVALAARWPSRLLPAALTTLFLVLLVWHPFPPSQQPGTLELTAIDVGQGESLLLSLPNGEMALVDGGGFPQFGRRTPPQMDVGEDVVSPYLWSRGIRRLSIIAVSHLHDDHCGGVAALMENFRPRELWTSFAPDAKVWRALEETARRCGVRIRVLKEGDDLDLGGVRWQTLAPARQQRWTGRPQNNDSLVFRLRHGRHSFLLTGDIEQGVERRLLEEAALQHVDVLKVAHHGSKRSSSDAWLDAMNPSVALVSAGTGNMYGLPHPRVIDQLNTHHALILRTDQDGLVTVRSDGRYLTVGKARWEPPEWRLLDLD
ncbi:DNA internalization-related competence protein ComEC/Rec2 [Paludibaculum fermentans]|uniref:DNA internalization-related competence protein ComEC/Rec2 n=1 Tax=Paludibaculum fermentans TaxID=1473598 RepID=A0A7S7NL67_PALFE|nr:DNA internalization-related competence protein ComEC/Rec2 [Paludibaculum fermentans]QOY85683.1 DNA internalization-related competence protein ComEC/Rec2 [Paludibaculum fermentans]